MKNQTPAKKTEKSNLLACCQNSPKENKGFLAGLAYGLLPHAGCLAFIALSLVGATTATAFLKPLMLKSWFFYMLIASSVGFATLSAGIYLKKNSLFSFSGIREKKSYLTILYGTTLLVNCLFFFLIFPYLANVAPAETGLSGAITAKGDSGNLQEISLAVSIPCSGHASLISRELYKIDGVSHVRYQLPNIFKIQFDLTKTNQEEILSQAIFQEFPTKIVS